MSAWTNLINALFLPQKPILGSIGLALRDNVVALAAGSAGAPRIQTAALQPPAAGSTFILRRIQEEEVFTAETAYPGVGFHNAASAAQHLGFHALVSGIVRCEVWHRVSASSSISEVRVLKNGVPVATWTTNSTSLVQRLVDVSVVIGDEIIFQHRRSFGADLSVWRFIRVTSAHFSLAVA